MICTCGHEFEPELHPLEHRLLVGDSTKVADVERVMGGESYDLIFTDPPYNCADKMSESFYQGCHSPAMKELSTTEWDQGFDIKSWLSILEPPKDGTVYVCTSHTLAPDIWEWMESTHSGHHGYCVWTKPNPMPSLAKRHPTWATELICYATYGKHAFNFPKEGHEFNWWDIPSTAKADGHPTQKPLQVPAKAIGLSSNTGDTVYDPFLGSGTTMAAAEQLGRKCFGIEISPKYCAVILERMKNLGCEPRLESSEQ